MWNATFVVRINRYHAYNGIFSEQPFILAIEDYNQTTTFCGVGSHHQNVIVEIKFQILTLGARNFLLNKIAIEQRQ